MRFTHIDVNLLAKVHGVVHEPCMYHVPHLDLVDIDQNMSATARLIITCDPVKKFKLVDATAL